MPQYDALLLVSFGGPEGPDEVLPFLENVLRGRNVPRQRMLEVAEHYQQFGGVSPLNQQNRDLIAALSVELRRHGIALPIYFGNRNWHPLLADTLREMSAAGVGRALALVTSAYSSYSGCRQYREDIERAQAEVGAGAPQVDKIRAFFNHPGFVEATTDRVRESLEQIASERRTEAVVLFSAHSIPTTMAEGCAYETQLREVGRLVAESLGCAHWQLVFQSRSGPATQPWLGPDVCDALRTLAAARPESDVVIAPIGFLSDHLEVLYDLDTEAKSAARELHLNVVRAATVGNHPLFISALRELIQERLGDSPQRASVGRLGPLPDVCPKDCCLPAPRVK
jgi:ferrochelatase